MQEQARQQAQDQFEHWLRQERRAVYTDVLQDADDLRSKFDALVDCRSEIGDGSTAVEALLEFDTAFQLLGRRVVSLTTVAHPEVAKMYQRVMAECQTVLSIVRGNFPPDSLLVHKTYLYLAIGELVAAVSVDTQVGPAERRGMR
ncbi:hypothetical protein GCM10010313_78080 [Streptomyces violarus]|uniref:Uncharacterized protein n=1 Tax=Streptomyces violarus TaxID=67380 RepID=A0A7W5F2J6_9ACTN|nr:MULTISPECIES: hypothetical protein [Streptomyces]MBB3077717.1 hypothetical protein [Streptomyces violarus]WRU00098.1 hypothetical protein VJ737_21415 [Streptomyces sp. CGMCC 4.1772]GHD33039.1 hypothetical protein GCM10010313_78080 [Streptomyces violarus]